MSKEELGALGLESKAAKQKLEQEGFPEGAVLPDVKNINEAKEKLGLETSDSDTAKDTVRELGEEARELTHKLRGKHISSLG